MNDTEKKEIFFAVVIPVKDRVPELRQTLFSIYQQTVLPREIIIVDDCSTVPLALEHIPAPPQGIILRIMRNEVNLGGAASMNRAVAQTSQPCVTLLDSDDCYLPDSIEKFTEAWQVASSETQCIIGGFYWCTDDLIPYRVQIAPASLSHFTLLTQGNIAGGSSVFSFRRDAYMAVGGHPEIRGNHDWGLLLRLAAYGKVISLTTPVTLYRSPSTNSLPTYTKSYRRIILAYYRLYRMQNADDRLIMKPLVRKMMLKHLSSLGRRGLFRTVFCSLLAHGQNPFQSRMAIAAFLFGLRRVDKILYVYAHIRASFIGEKLLRRYGYVRATATSLARMK